MTPSICPSCQSRLKIKSLRCDGCGTEIHGLFELSPLAKLSLEDQKFVLDFVKNSGSIKKMAQQLDLSYPTVRNLLDDIINNIKEKENEK